MGTPKGSKNSSDRQKWNKIFNGLVHMLQTQQTQLDSLAKERKILEERIKLQYDRWVDDVNFYRDQICEMKTEFTVHEMERMVEAAKSDLMIGLKHREAFTYKHRLENAASDLEDFKAWCDLLFDRISEPKGTLKAAIQKGDENHVKALESEVKSLKSKNEKLLSNSNSDVSNLIREKDFVWNQYNKMESNLTDQLRNKRAELELANGKIQKLLADLEQLQSSNTEKDSMIATLEAAMTKLQSDSNKKSEEISRLSKEMELVKRSRSNSVTPTLRHCTVEPGKTPRGTLSSGLDGRAVAAKKESYPSPFPEQGCRSSKRKEVDHISEAPKLFLSRFKVLKLKNMSPLVI